ncbi:MAG: TolC family protein [Bacteroidetes bacterium]|nr:TolC family protein [Bacteroidota bacterium]
MRTSLIFLSLTALIASSYTVKAQDTTYLSLDDCMKYAMKHNYTARNSHLDVLIQEAQVKETLAAAYPHINGKAEFDDYVNPPVLLVPANAFSSFGGGGGGAINKDSTIALSFTPKYSASATLTGSQTIFDGSVLVALKARKSVLELARQNAEVSNETIRYNVFKAYNSLVIAYRQYDITKTSLAYARSIEHDLIVTQQAGFAEKIDVERTSVQVNNLATDSIRIENLLAVSEQALKYQMGMDINTPIVLTDTNVAEHRQETMSLLEEESDYNRIPEFRLSEAALKVNEYNVQRYKLAALPSLNAIASTGYNYATDNFTDLFHKQYIFSTLVGLQLNVPIFNGMLRVNQLREAKLNVEKSKNNIEFAKQSIDFQSAQSRTTLKNAILQVQSQRRNLELANDVLDLSQKKYKAGVGSNMEVTTAQTDQLRAQTNYFNALLDLINAEADLKKALGLLK